MFLRIGHSELTKTTVSEPRTLSLNACVAKSPARDLGTFLKNAILETRVWRGTIKGGVQDLGHRLLTADLRTSDLWTLTADC